MWNFVATLLVQRGVETFERTKNFFRPSLDPCTILPDEDMDKAVAQVKQPLKPGNIMVLVITMSMEQPQYHWYLLTQIIIPT
jgi:hypothetical protein